MLLKNILELLGNRETIKYIEAIPELKAEAETTNQLLTEIKDLLTTNLINISQFDSSKKPSKIYSSKEYIPDPNISGAITSNKEVKEETKEYSNISDTLESLSKLNLQENIKK